jgi:Na+-driven multidrug efflux pump
MTLANLSTPLLGFADATVIGRLGSAHLLGAIAAASIVFDFVFWGFGFFFVWVPQALLRRQKGNATAKRRKPYSPVP